MLQIRELRKHITDRLDEISVLRKSISGDNIDIIETENPNDADRRRIANKELLDKVTVCHIPSKNVWIFENEFEHQTFSNVLLNNQKGAFTSSGKKVEKTIIYHNNQKLYVFLFEMKRTISPRKMHDDVVKKFESSLSTISVFISANIDIPELENATIFPVGVCCYNYYDDNQPNRNNDPTRTTGKVRQEYSNGQRVIPLMIEPIGLNRIKIPVFFMENPNQNPVTNNFEVALNSIIEKIEN